MTSRIRYLHNRLDELDRQIDAYPQWGAALAAMVEERDGIAKALGITPRRMVGGVPKAD